MHVDQCRCVSCSLARRPELCRGATRGPAAIASRSAHSSFLVAPGDRRRRRAAACGDPLTGRAAVVLNPRATSRTRAGSGTLSLEGWCLCPGILDSLGPLHAPNVTGPAATSGKQKDSVIPTSV